MVVVVVVVAVVEMDGDHQRARVGPHHSGVLSQVEPHQL